MAVPFSNTKLRVPHGFQILLEGVAKEVLQMQPNDIFAFSAVYFENLLQLRETGVLDPVAQMSTTQDRMYNNKAFQKPDVDVNNDEQQDAAVKIQTKYRQHQSKAVVDQMRQDKAATRIQAGIRGHLGRKRVANLRKEVASSSQRSSNAEDGNDLEELAQEDEFNINEEEEETARTPQGSIDPEMTTRLDPEETASSRSPVNDEDRGTGFDLNDPEVQLAATKIQAGFRGMHTRHQLKPPRKVKPEETASSRSSVDDEDRGTGFDLNDPEVQLAATKIQAGFRGMHTRHQLKPPRQADVSKDNVEEDLTARFEGDESTAFEEPEPEEEERERQETPTTKLEMSRGGMQGDITQEDENAEVEFSEDDPEMIKAIEEIQAGFSRLKAESENEHEVVESNDQENLEIDAAATKIQAGFKGMRLRKELKEKKLEKKVINEEPKEMQPEEDTDAGNLNSDAELTVAANKIQAGFRGYKTRQEVHKLRKVKGEELVSQEKMKEEHEAEENINNSDDDEKRVVAASKIQAGFKGYQTRREVEVVRRQRANDEKRVVAASKIQAGFKGYKTRREVEVVRRQRANVCEVNEEEGHEERRDEEK